MADYQLQPAGTNVVLRVADGAFIPMDEGNADYQAFLAWQAAGNAPDPIPAALGPADETWSGDPWTF